MGDVSKVEQTIWVLLDSAVTSFSATPTAARAAERRVRGGANMVINQMFGGPV